MTVAALLEGTPAVAARIVGDASASIGGMALDSRRIEPGDLFCCLRGEHDDGHRFAGAAMAAGAGQPAGRPRARPRRAPGRRPGHAPRHGPAGGHAVGPPLAADDDDRRDGHERQDDDHGARGRGPRRGRLVDGRDRDPHRLLHDARGPRAPGPPGRAGRRGPAGRRHGGLLARPRDAPGRRHALRGVGLHQPRARPPRLPRDDGALLRRQGRAVHTGPDRPRRRQRRRRARSADS